VLEGRSWQPLKERFTRSILYRLDCFDLSEDQRQQLDPNFSEELNFEECGGLRWRCEFWRWTRRGEGWV
jgi:hypothetical protein